MDVASHHQNQGRTVVGQLTEETTDTPGHAIGKTTAACYEAERGQVPLGCWLRDGLPRVPSAQASYPNSSCLVSLQMSTVIPSEAELQARGLH